MKQVGLFFGSFNPIHTGHLIIANHLAYNSYLQEVWFIVSPQNPFKETHSLLNEQHRFMLIQRAIEGESRLKVSNIEFKLPRPSYTINTLTHLKEKYPSYEFTIIMGSDGFQNIDKWKNSSILLKEYPFLIYKRPGFPVQEHAFARFQIVEAPMLDISSTHIRYMIKSNKPIRYLVTDIVREEIEKNLFYHNRLENPPQ